MYEIPTFLPGLGRDGMHLILSYPCWIRWFEVLVMVRVPRIGINNCLGSRRDCYLYVTISSVSEMICYGNKTVYSLQHV